MRTRSARRAVWLATTPFVTLFLALALALPSLSEVGARGSQISPTATPTPLPLILSSSAEALFPIGALISARLSIPQRLIRSARVRVAQPGATKTDPPVKVWEAQVDLFQDVSYLSETASLIKYVWTVTPHTAPPPFTTLRYEIEVRAIGRAAPEIAKGEWVYQDTRRPDPEPVTEWQRSSSDSPVVLYSHNRELALNLLAPIAQRVHERVRADTGIQREYKILIYDPGAAFCLRDPGSGELYLDSRFIGGTRRPCDPIWAEQIYRRFGYRLLRRTDRTFNGAQDALTTLLVSDHYRALWRSTGAVVPPWFADGLFQLYNTTARSGTLALARDAQRAGLLLSLGELASGPPSDSDGARLRLWHAQSYLMVLYLASRYGAAAPFELARALAADVSLEDAARARYGIGLREWEADWRRWLTSDAAAAALRWTPYLVVTPLPTNSPTPFPSATPTPSEPTATRTPTPTRTRFPTNTPIPATPTNTPLPPGQLQRPTPIPSPTPTPAGGGGICGGAALPILLVLPAGAILLRRARMARGIAQSVGRLYKAV